MTADGDRVVSLLCRGKPAVAGKTGHKSAQAFLADLARSHLAAGSPRLSGLLYGIVYWFVFGYDTGQHPDADNISKPIWDRLGKHYDPSAGGCPAFQDDKQVRLRLAGIYDVGPSRAGGDALEELDLTNVPVSVAAELGDFLSQDGTFPLGRSLTYVEIGSLRQDLFMFNLHEKGDMA